jgi:hypothetical protein
MISRWEQEFVGRASEAFKKRPIGSRKGQDGNKKPRAYPETLKQKPGSPKPRLLWKVYLATGTIVPIAVVAVKLQSYFPTE